MAQYDLLDKLRSDGRAINVEKNEFSHYTNGEVISARPGPEWAEETFRLCLVVSVLVLRLLNIVLSLHSVIHRADYRQILTEEATRLGADVRLGCRVMHIDCHSAYAELADGEKVQADVIIGADGMSIRL